MLILLFGACLLLCRLDIVRSSCPAQYSLIGGTCIKYVTTSSTRAVAQAACRAAGDGWLLRLDSSALVDALSASAIAPTVDSWIGLTKSESCQNSCDLPDKMEWDLAGGNVVSFSTYLNFADSEPDSYSSENCFAVDTSGEWRDYPCGHSLSYYCEANEVGYTLPCPPTYFQYQSSCLRKSGKLLSWSAARNVCREDNGWLVTIEDSEKQDLLEDWVKHTAYTWIGLHKSADCTLSTPCEIGVNMAWDTAPGRVASSSDYQNFQSSRPNVGSEWCFFTKDDAEWNDEDCVNSYNYICETSVIVATGSPSSAPSGKPSSSPTTRPSGWPSGVPSVVPSSGPSSQPTTLPTRIPTIIPSVVPTGGPSTQPTDAPSAIPSSIPSEIPSSSPTAAPSSLPTDNPTTLPSELPTANPSELPSGEPSGPPSSQPTTEPSEAPTSRPSDHPTVVPSRAPSGDPSVQPSRLPTGRPSGHPSIEPSTSPSGSPSAEPSRRPSSTPTAAPSTEPSGAPSNEPSGEPSRQPSGRPSGVPSISPSGSPSAEPSCRPSSTPTAAPSTEPSGVPSSSPSGKPSGKPSMFPTAMPSSIPTIVPSADPTGRPSGEPTCRPSATPTMLPTAIPTAEPSSVPSLEPSGQPSLPPTTIPSSCPSSTPSVNPTGGPSAEPSSRPSSAPTGVPSTTPTGEPSRPPSGAPSGQPSRHPTATPSCSPSSVPSAKPTGHPSSEPTCRASGTPTSAPSGAPSGEPSGPPAASPTTIPSNYPSSTPTGVPTGIPSGIPSDQTSSAPTIGPNAQPTYHPTCRPSEGPSKEQSTLPTIAPTGNITNRPTALPTYMVPPAPRLLSAKFSTGGHTIVLRFDSTVDFSAIQTSLAPFPCIRLFYFPGASLSSCQWTLGSTCIVSLNGDANVIMVGDTIQVFADSLRAACPTEYPRSVCDNFAYLESSSVFLGPPEIVIQPIAITPAIQSSVCSGAVFDWSMSYGHGGRNFSIFEISVTSTSSKAHLLGDFLQESSVLYSPVFVPGTLMESGQRYDISIRICNFLGGCGEGETSLMVRSSDVPNVVIYGASVRTISPASSAQLEATASLTLCSGRVGPSYDLSYSWWVEDSGLIVPVVSASRDMTKFVTHPYSFEGGRSYNVHLNVSHRLSPYQWAVTTVEINVLEGNINAVIAEGRSIFLPYDSPVVLDGSRSYDANHSPLDEKGTTLLFTWTCVQLLNGISTGNCPLLTMTPAADASTVEVRYEFSNSNYFPYQFEVTLVVQDSNNTLRNDSSTTVLTLLRPAAPLLTIKPLSTVQKLNPRESLKLSAQIVTLTTNLAAWSINVSAVNVDNIFLTKRSRVLSPGRSTFPMVLAASSLPGGTVFTITLRCGTSESSVIVSTNSPPVPGYFHVSPNSGVAISTPFKLRSSYWSDDDSPLSYEYGYLSLSSGTFLVLLAQSAASTGTTLLPDGNDRKSFELRCYVKVYDFLGAYTASYDTVTVSPGQEDLLGNLSLVVQRAGTVHTLKNAISLSVSVLNRHNCSDSPVCLALNRQPCGSTDHTCGRCMGSYYGEPGDDNSMCYNVSILRVLRDGSAAPSIPCSSTTECPPLHECAVGDVPTAQIFCTAIMKQCVANCSGHGVCRFISALDGLLVDTCSALNFGCSAQCQCDLGYSGMSCSVGPGRSGKTDLQEAVINGFVTLIESDNPSADSLAGTIASLAAATENVYALTEAASMVVLEVVEAILEDSTDVEVPVADLKVLLSSVDSVLSSFGSNSVTRRRLLSALSTSNFWEQFIDALDTYGSTIAADMSSGQESETVVKDTFRSTIRVFGDGSERVTAYSALNSFEMSAGIAPNSVSLEDSGSAPDETLQLHSTVIRADLYTERSMHSNAFRVVARGNNVSKYFRFVIQHSRVTFFGTILANTTISTECNSGEIEYVNHSCPLTNYEIVHFCNGSAAQLTSHCPDLRSVSVCRIFESGRLLEPTRQVQCSVDSFTETNTTCLCLMNSRADRGNLQRHSRRRAQSGSDSLYVDSGAIEVAAMSELVASDFLGTLYVAKELDSLEDIRRVLIVILLYGVMWTVGLIYLLLLAHTEVGTKRKVTNFDVLHSVKANAIAKATTDPDRIRKYLNDYLDLTFPTVFGVTPWFDRLKEEISKHHRYLYIFNRSAEPKRRFITGVHLLTIQSMLMFMLAVFYDLQFPDDDGSCDSLGYSNCEDEKSVFESSKSKCQWSADSGSCELRHIALGWELVVIISLVVAIFTAPINLVVDFAFDEILLAPTADALKVRAADTTLKRAGRRMSNAVRRASVQAGDALAQLGQKTKLRSQSINANQRKLSTVSTRNIPPAAHTAQQLALASVSNISESVKTRNTIYENNRKETSRNRRAAFREDLESHDASGSSKKVKGFKVPERVYSDLVREISLQRKLLKPSVQDVFDMQWGVDPTGELSADRSRVLLCIPWKDSQADRIMDELAYVQTETMKKYIKLKTAEDVHIGLEILHLFVLDLLGRVSPAARIFLTKTDTDFRHEWVVTKKAKLMCWAAIIMLICFFVYFSLLRGLQRGREWQLGYMYASLIQLVVEIMIYETSECIWVHFLIPDTVSADIRTIQLSLRCTIDTMVLPNSGDVVNPLDAPTYLFVSTNLAKRFPDILESMIVQSYHHYLPGEISKQWSTSHHSPTKNTTGVLNWVSFLRNFSVSAVMITILKYIGSTPASMQRVMIHSLQPIVLTAVLVAGYYLLLRPLFFIFFAALPLYFLWDTYWRTKSRTDSKVSPINVPLSSHVDITDSGAATSKLTVDSELHFLEPGRSIDSYLEPANASKVRGFEASAETGPNGATGVTMWKPREALDSRASFSVDDSEDSEESSNSGSLYETDSGCSSALAEVSPPAEGVRCAAPVSVTSPAPSRISFENAPVDIWTISDDSDDE